MPQAPDLIGSIEASRILGCSARTIHRLVIDEKLAPAVVAPGGRAGVYLFRRRDVENIRRAREAEQAEHAS